MLFLLCRSHPSKHLLVFKTSWRSTQDMSWRCLQHVSSVTIFRLPGHFQDVLQIRFENVLRTSSRRLERRKIVTLKTSWRRLEDMFWRRLKGMSWRRLEEVLEINKMFTRISVLIRGLLRNLNQYLTNLYFTNLRKIQNALIRTQSAELFRNRHYRTGEAIKTKF